MDKDNKPSEEQVKAVNEAEKAKWEDDFPEDQLKVPYSRDAKDDDKDDKKADDDDELDANDDIDYSDPEPVVKTTDPGEYKEADYSFDITLDGKTTTIKTPDQATEFADTHAEEFTARNLLDFTRKANKMESNLEKDKQNWESQKEKFDSETTQEQERIDTIQNLANEIQYMITKGLLPDIADEYKTADWTDPEVAKQPGVKEQIELVNYMTKENNARAKMGVKPFNSMTEAYNSMMLEQGRGEKDASKKKSDEARKKVASTVSRPSATSEGARKSPKGIAVGNPNVLKRNSVIWE